MLKNTIVLNEFNYLNDKCVYSSEDFDIKGFIVKPNGIHLEVISLMQYKSEDSDDIYSYHYFDINLEEQYKVKEDLITKLKDMYLDNSLETEGISVSGSKEQIVDDLLKHFPLDSKIVINMLMM